MNYLKQLVKQRLFPKPNNETVIDHILTIVVIFLIVVYKLNKP
jgi:hypothetical protein